MQCELNFRLYVYIDLSQFLLFKWQLSVLLSYIKCLIIKVLTFDIVILDMLK